MIITMTSAYKSTSYSDDEKFIVEYIHAIDS